MTRKLQTPGAAAEPSHDDEHHDAAPAAETTEGLSPETAKLVEQLVARKLAAVQAPAPADKRGPKPVSMEAAKVMVQDSLARGIRPRAILTTEGWYCHSEMARAKVMGADDKA